MSVKIDIISGFLGAGKTTLIKKLLDEKLNNERIAIIENEFGEIGIDGTLLKKSGIEVKEINSGCICCTLVGDFGKAIKELISTYRPERIIIEPSGVGKLSDVIKTCNSPELKESLKINMLVAVVDVLKYQIYINNFGEFFENQIKHARNIILSRTQKTDNKKLELIVNSVRKLNSDANIITTPWEELNASLIISVAEQDVSVSLEHQMKNSDKRFTDIENPRSLLVLNVKRGTGKAGTNRHVHNGEHNCSCGHNHIHHSEHNCSCGHNHVHDKDCGCGHGHKHNHSAEEVFDVWGMETPKTFGEKELSSILDTLGNDNSYGMILRGKGIIKADTDKWIQFDYVPGEYGIKDSSSDYTGRLCIIGKDLNKAALCELFKV